MLKEKIKRIVQRQKEDQAKFPLGIYREKAEDIDVNSKQAIVLSGIRRCGKSTLMRQISKKLNKYNYFNFDDPRALDFEIEDFERLKDAYNEEFGDSDYFLFDEIQNVEKWEMAIRLLLDQRKKVILTGSNASLLSRELGTRLTGRYLRYELFPFSYSEFLTFTKKKESAESFKEFLKCGGFPEYLEKGNAETLHLLLQDIVSRDVAVRHAIRNTKTLNELSIYLLSNVGKEFTYNKLKKTFGMGSPNTAIDFVAYLEDSYLIFTINKFDYSLRKQQVNPKKVYSIDNGISNVNSVTFSDNKGRMLENAVFQHLRRKHREIFYFKEDYECDFVIKEKNKITQAVQVCYQVTDDNKKREFSGLLEALNEFKLKQGVIVTFDQEDSFVENGKTIKIIPGWKWFS